MVSRWHICAGFADLVGKKTSKPFVQACRRRSAEANPTVAHMTSDKGDVLLLGHQKQTRFHLKVVGENPDMGLAQSTLPIQDQ